VHIHQFESCSFDGIYIDKSKCFHHVYVNIINIDRLISGIQQSKNAAINWKLVVDDNDAFDGSL
jgi:hypothetical protein